MFRVLCTVSMVMAFAAFALAAPDAKKTVKPSKQWSGAVDDEEKMRDLPEAITDAKTFDKLWKAWKLPGKMPEIDFSKNIVVTCTTGGSRLFNVTAMLDDKGDLQVFGAATMDLVPGFRYVVLVLGREGVQSVNGKKL